MTVAADPRDVMTRAMIMECDWDFIRLFYDSAELPGRWAAYHAACRAKLLSECGWAPYPFDKETP